MGISDIQVRRFSVGGFGDLRLEKRGLGVMRRWLPIRAPVSWNCQAASGGARSALVGFCAIRRSLWLP
jgi:hypothetical protein